MQLTDMLGQTGGLQSMARELGIDDVQASAGAQALLPSILGGFKKQAQAHPGGLEGLGGMLSSLGGASLLEDVLSPQPTNVGRGNDVLGQIFGSKDVSRTVAQNAAGSSGLDPALLRKMLPMVAMLAAGFMAKRSAAAPSPSPAGGLGSMLSGLVGESSSPAMGLASMIDMNGDGNPLDDIMKMAGKVLG